VIELHLLRHADAGDPLAWTRPDEQRPLSGKGEKQADRLARFLAGTAFRPDALISSPKVRAEQTARPVGDALGVPVTIDERLTGPFGLAELEAVLRDAGDPIRPVLVGHDPDFSDTVEILLGSSGLTMKKGAMLRIDVERPLRPGGGSLVWLVTPDLLKPAR
jgi:phosphohistidine phosphatase SixA